MNTLRVDFYFGEMPSFLLEAALKPLILEGLTMEFDKGIFAVPTQSLEGGLRAEQGVCQVDVVICVNH